MHPRAPYQTVISARLASVWCVLHTLPLWFKTLLVALLTFLTYIILHIYGTVTPPALLYIADTNQSQPLLIQLQQQGVPLNVLDYRLTKRYPSPKAGWVRFDSSKKISRETLIRTLHEKPREKTRRIVMYSANTLEDFATITGKQTRLSPQKIIEQYHHYSPYQDGGIIAGYYRIPYRTTSDAITYYMVSSSEKRFALWAEKYLGSYDTQGWNRILIIASIIGRGARFLTIGVLIFVFGESIRPAQLSKDLDRILLGRPIDAFPLAEDAGKAPPLLEGAFLDLLQSDGLVLTFPPSLQLLLQGVNLINSHLERSNRTKNGVRMPEATDRRVVVHGGLFPPGLPLPKRIADGVTLRLLAVNNIPLVSLATALLLLDRRGGLPLSVHKGNNGPTVSHDGIPMGDLAQVLEGAAESQGWMVSRQTRADPNTLLSDVLVSLGIAHRLAHRLVLDEDFFVRLKHEPEDQEIANKLAWVEDLIQRYIEEMVAE